MKALLKLILGTSFLFIFSTLQVLAEPSVSSKVSATEVGLNGSLTLNIEVSGINNIGGSPQLNIPDFQVDPAGQTSSYQWINGQSSSFVSFNYLLTPLKIGTLQIPAISLTVDGKTYSTQPIQILVRSDNNSAPVTGQNFQSPPVKSVQVPTEGLKPVFIAAMVDNEKAYVGQQILLKVQFLRRPDVRLTSQPRYSEPETTGFLVEQLKQQEYVTNINGVNYEVTEIPYALFPTSDGEFTIGSAQIELAVRRQNQAVDPFDPDSFFQNFFGRSEVARLKTNAIPIQIRPLPKNKPPYFSGSVGRFKIEAKTDTDQLEVGKPFNLILKVEGVGNIAAIKEPYLPELKGFRRYETISKPTVAKDGKFVHGSKEFKILLIPQVSGPLTIPSASFGYFNPTENEFKTESSKEMTFQVKPGTLSQANENNITTAAPQVDPATGIQVVERDIRFIKTGRVKKLRPPLVAQPWYLLSCGFPLLFAFTAFLIKRHDDKKSKNPDYFRSRLAFRNARRKIKLAARVMNSDSSKFYEFLHNALNDYLADKLGLSSSGMVWNDIEFKLNLNKIDSQLAASIKSFLDELEMARFAPSSISDENRDVTLQRMSTLIKLLEKSL